MDNNFFEVRMQYKRQYKIKKNNKNKKINLIYNGG